MNISAPAEPAEPIEAAGASPADPSEAVGAPALRLGFTRGTAPSKWAKRWVLAGGDPLELVPVEVAFGRDRAIDLDVMLERTGPGERPTDSFGDAKTRHAIRLYTEAVALVIPADHELAQEPSVAVDALELVKLIDHPDHFVGWPAAQPWEDPAWMPADAQAALALVATGVGAMLLPLPLARHLAGKRDHAVLEVVASGPAVRTGALGDDADAPLAGSAIWASWDVRRDAPDVQQLVGIMRGRTARSSRPLAEAERAEQAQAAREAESAGSGTDAAGSRAPGNARDQRRAAKAGAQQQSGAGAKGAGSQKSGGSGAKKSGPKPGSRGAQLQAAKEKAERAKALKRKAKKRR